MSNPPVKSRPLIRPMCDFPDGPWVYPPTFTELTNYVRDESEIEITHGRSNEFSQFNPGKLSGLVLDNRTRTFDSTYAAAPTPFRNNQQPSKQLQLMAEYPWLPGQLPDGPQRNTTWTTGAGTSTPALTSAVGFANSTPLQAVNFSVTNATANGNLPYSTVATNIPLTAGQPILAALRAGCSRSGGKMEIIIQFFNGATFLSQSVGTVVTTTGALTGAGLAAAPWFLVTSPNGVTAPANTTNCSILVAMPSSTNGDNWWVDAVVVEYSKAYIYTSLIYAYVDEWKISYSGRDSTCRVEATDALASFAVKDLTSVGYENAVLALANLRHYWPLDEYTEWSQPYTFDLAPTSPKPLAVHGFAAWGLPGPLIAELANAVGLTLDPTGVIGGWLDPNVMISPTPATGYTFGIWIQTQTVPSVNTGVMSVGMLTDPNSGQGTISLMFGANDQALPPRSYTWQMKAGSPFVSTNGVYFRPADTIDPVTGLTIQGNAYDGAWHFAVITKAADDRTWAFYVDGVQVLPGINAGTGTLSGLNYVADQAQSFPTPLQGNIGGQFLKGVPGFTGQLAQCMVVDRAITASEVANLYNLGQKAWFGQTPGQRLNAVLDTVSFPSAMRSIDAGSSTFDAVNASLAQTNAAQYMQYVADSENGWVFADKSGNMRLIARNTLLKPPYNTPQWVMGDLWPPNSAVELPIAPVEWSNSNTLIFTEGEGSTGTGATGSGTRTKTGSNLFIFADNTTLVNQGKRTISKTNLLNSTDAEVFSLLQYLVNQYKLPQPRLPAIKLDPTGDDNVWNFVLTAEIGQACQVNLRPPPSGSAMTTFYGRIQSITHHIGRGKWDTEIQLAAVDFQSYLLLDDSVKGKLDSGNKLSY